jgi:rhodanese-related sulfurtransferase
MSFRTVLSSFLLSIAFLFAQFSCTKWLGLRLLRRFSWASVMTYFLLLIRRHFPQVKQMSTDQLASLLQSSPSDVVILDTRSADEFSLSHIDGARHTPVDTPPQALLSTLTPAHRVVCMCSIGYRSSFYAAALTKAGAPCPAYNLEGSLFKWAAEGRALVTADGARTSLVHPYSDVFGCMLPRTNWPRSFTPVQ